MCHTQELGPARSSVLRHEVVTQVLMKITCCQLVKGYGRFGGTQSLHLGLLALKK